MAKRKIAGQAIALAAGAAMSVTSVQAYEFGGPAQVVQPGVNLGNNSAAAPPPGIYMIDQFISYQSSLVGPGAPYVNHSATTVDANIITGVLLFVPGWTFLGANYDAVLVQPYGVGAAGAPIGQLKAGLHNTYIIPAELSWKLGDSGFYVKAGLGVSIPDGTIQGATGLNSIGNPWWSFVPQLSFSYLKDGWNLTLISQYETNTKNTITNYKSGDVLDVAFIATKAIGKWTLGPVGYYVGQVTNDRSSAFYHNAINVNRYNVWAAGGFVGYNFGPAQLNVWMVDEFSANASGPAGSVTQGVKFFASLNYRIWAPDEPVTPKRPQFYSK